MARLRSAITNAIAKLNDEPQVVRKDDVIFQSPHQQHSFNFPYQLGRREVDAANETPARAQVTIDIPALVHPRNCRQS